LQEEKVQIDSRQRGGFHAHPRNWKKVKAKDFCASLTIGAEVVYGEEKSLLFHLVQIALKVQTNEFSLPFYTRVLCSSLLAKLCHAKRSFSNKCVWLSVLQKEESFKMFYEPRNIKVIPLSHPL
jgi:hypothetical protein